MGLLWVMTLSDLRQRIRDRSVLIFALVVPLALMFVFNLTFGGATDLDLEPVTVGVSAPAATLWPSQWSPPSPASRGSMSQCARSRRRRPRRRPAPAMPRSASSCRRDSAAPSPRGRVRWST